MLPIAVLALLVAGCFAESCPNVEPSSTFDATKLDGTWYMLMHTEKSEFDNGCCKCVRSFYSRNSDGFITANRTGLKFDGSHYNYFSGLRPVAGSDGRYFLLRKSGGNWVETGMKITFYMPQGHMCMGIYGCMPKDQTTKSTAVFFCKDYNDYQKREQFKTWLTNNGLNFDNFYYIEHENCNY